LKKEEETIAKVNPTSNNALVNDHESGEDDADFFLESIGFLAVSISLLI
jgi:hypothetical protein